MTSWKEIVDEATKIFGADPFMRVIVKSLILNHDSYANAIAFSLAQTFGGVVPFSQWYHLFLSVLNRSAEYEQGMNTVDEMGLIDLNVISERDPASEGLVNPFLNFKGFKALQAHRIAHVLWNEGRKDTARAIQSRCSEIFAVDIHPGAIIGAKL